MHKGKRYSIELTSGLYTIWWFLLGKKEADNILYRIMKKMQVEGLLK